MTSIPKRQVIRAGKRIVGEVVGDTFYKTIAPNHYLKKPPAIAFDVSSLNDAEQAGAVWAEVQDRSTGVIYRATVDRIRYKGFEFNRGWGNQIALTLNGWIKHKPGGGLQFSLMGDR